MGGWWKKLHDEKFFSILSSQHFLTSPLPNVLLEILLQAFAEFYLHDNEIVKDASGDFRHEITTLNRNEVPDNIETSSPPQIPTHDRPVTSPQNDVTDQNQISNENSDLNLENLNDLDLSPISIGKSDDEDDVNDDNDNQSSLDLSDDAILFQSFFNTDQHHENCSTSMNESNVMPKKDQADPPDQEMDDDDFDFDEAQLTQENGQKSQEIETFRGENEISVHSTPFQLSLPTENTNTSPNTMSLGQFLNQIIEQIFDPFLMALNDANTTKDSTKSEDQLVEDFLYQILGKSTGEKLPNNNLTKKVTFANTIKTIFNQFSDEVVGGILEEAIKRG